MTTLFPELQNDLAAGAERQTQARRRRRLPVIGGSLLAVIAVGGIATAATGIWSPQLGDQQRGTPTSSASPVPQDQLQALAVLRRPPGPEDRGSDVRYALRFMGDRYRGIRTDAVRRLAPASGPAGAEILIPVEYADGIKDALCLFTIDPAEGGGIGCFTLQQVREGKAVGIFASSAEMSETQRRRLQAAAEAAQSSFYARRRAARRDAEPLPKDPTARRRALREAYDAADRAGARARATQGLPAVPRTTSYRYSGLVPDGVARVVYTDASGTRTAAVKNNVYRLTVPVGSDRPSGIEWQDADGKTTTKP